MLQYTIDMEKYQLSSSKRALAKSVVKSHLL